MLKNLAIPHKQRLLVDSGALLFTTTHVPSGTRLAQDKVRAQAIIESYNIMGYDAVAIANRDLAAGIDFLQELSKEANFPLISANILDPQDKPLFTPYITLKRNGLTITIIAVTGPGMNNATPSPSKTFHIAPWQQILPTLVADLAAKSDFLLVMSNLSREENKAISNSLPQINLIMQSGVLVSNMAPTMVNKTLITQTAKEGKYLGELTINWTASKTWQGKEQSLIKARQQKDQLLWQLKRLEKRGDPKQIYKDSPRTLARYTKLKEKIALLDGTIAQQEEKEKSPGYQQPATFISNFHAIKMVINDDPKIRALLQKNKDLVNKLLLNRGKIHQLRSYLGSNGCQKCHATIFNNWQTTPHARAFQTLVQKKQQHNVNCVFCHVTGLDENTAEITPTLPEDLRNVGCEQCHGPGLAHSQAPQTHALKTTFSANNCIPCHTQERDDNFNFATKKIMVH